MYGFNTRALVKSNMKLWIGFAAFNEAPNLERLVSDIASACLALRQDFAIVAYEDGSTDATRNILESLQTRYPLTLYSNPQNLGLGRGIEEMFQRVVAQAGDDDILITMDADNTHLPGYFPDFLRMIEQGHDVVIGSRFTATSHTSGFPLYREWLSMGARVYYGTLLHLPGVRDYTSGYRAYRVSALRRGLAAYPTLITRRGFECQVEILSRLYHTGASFGEIAIHYAYGNKQGRSKLKVWRTIARSLQVGWAMRQLLQKKDMVPRC